MKLASKAWLWGSVLFLLLFLGLAALSISSSEVDRLWLNAPDWSRAKLIGDASTKQAVSMALDGRGRIYLFALRDEAGTHRAQVYALDRQAEIIWERTLETEIAKPDNPQILWDGQGLALFWIDGHSLYGARLDTLGNVEAAPALLSGEENGSTYAVASSPEGAIAIWYGGTWREPGVYALPLGSPAGRATLVDTQGVQPTIQYDGLGTLHAAWVAYSPGETRPQLYYASYPGGLLRTEQQAFVAEPPIRADSDLQGPWLGLDRNRVYLFWLEVAQSGRQAYQIEAQYLSFPQGEPVLASVPGAITVPDTDELLYEPFPEGDLAAGQRVLLTEGRYPQSVSPSEIAIDTTSAQETALAVRAELQHERGNIVGQIGTLFLQDGAPTTYQLLSFDPVFSLAPAIASDQAGQLYATWIEGKEGSGYLIYFASTAPDIRQALNPLTQGDLIRMASDTFFGLLRGAVFFPIAALIWLVVPFLLLAATWIFRRNDETLTSRATLTSIALALLAYWAGKLVTFAGARSYVPFSAWIPIIPSYLAIPLQVGMPILTILVAMRTAWYVVHRLESKSAILFVLVYAGVDSLLTMAVYGGFLYDAF